MLKNQIAIDANYYIEKQLVKWACRMFTPILAKDELINELKLDEATGRLVTKQKLGTMQDTVEMRKGKRKDISMSKYRNLTAYKRLFTGPHTMVKTQVISRAAGGIAAFLVPLQKCLKCKSSLAGLERAICKACQPHREHIKLEIETERHRLTAEQTLAWQQCQVCVGGAATPIEEATPRTECDNCDCENFFRRTKLDMDVARVSDKLKLF